MDKITILSMNQRQMDGIMGVNERPDTARIISGFHDWVVLIILEISKYAMLRIKIGIMDKYDPWMIHNLRSKSADHLSVHFGHL